MRQQPAPLPPQTPPLTHPPTQCNSKGDVAGRIHFLRTPQREPVVLRHPIDGVVFAKRQPGRVRPGNCCFVLATEYPEALAEEGDADER